MEKKIPSKHIWTGAIAWMVRNNVAANILMWAMLLGGAIFLYTNKQEVMPLFELDVVTVRLELSGANPEEVERSMVIAVEDIVRGLDGVDTVTSVIRSSGIALINVEAIDGIDRNKFLADIQAEVDRISTFPEEAELPQITLVSRSIEIMTLILSGTDNVLFLREWAENLESELLLQPRITQAYIVNVPEKEIQIEIKQDTLRKYGVTLSDIALAIQNSSIEQGAGSIETRDGDISIKLNDRRDYATEFADLAVISLSDGSRVLLEDIAEIKETFADRKSWSQFNRLPAISVRVNSVGDQSPRQIAEATLEVVERLNASMPGDLHIDVLFNNADVFNDRAELLSKNAILGVVLVFLCLALFLEPKLAFWVSLGIPISIIGSFLFLNPYGSTINMMTMFAFILTLGIVVDDAIVVGENVHIWRRRGYSREEAAVLGTKEIAVPIVFSILTNIVAFLPILLIPGRLGMLFAPIVAVVCTVFMCSLIESLFVMPCHLAHDSKPKPGSILFRLHAYQHLFSSGFLKWVDRVYGPILHNVLQHKHSVVALCIGFLILSGAYISSGRLGMELMPTAEADFAMAEIIFPTSTSAQDIASMRDQLYDSAEQVIEANGGDSLSRGIYMNAYGATIDARIYLTDSDKRPINTSEVTRQWQEATGEIIGAETVQFLADKGGPGSTKGLTIRLAHRDADVLQEAAEELASELRQFPNVADIDTGASRQNKEIQVKLKPLAEKLGLTSKYISTELRASFEGITVLRQQRGASEITVRVRLPEEHRSDIKTFNSLVIRTPKGEEVLLSDVVEIIEGTVPAMIRREDGQRTLAVSANVNPKSEASLILTSVQEHILPELLNKYHGLTWSRGGMQKDISESMEGLIIGIILVLLSIYVLLAIPFKSYTQPIIIMVAIPFGIVGAVIGHLIMGYSLSMISFMGILALSGLVVNDSLMLIAFANNERDNGKNAYDAMHNAGIRRFRPILLTTLTTFIGLMPMLLETSRQARFMIPIAISLGFGVLFATIITLGLVPALYLIIEDFFQHKILKKIEE